MILAEKPSAPSAAGAALSRSEPLRAAASRCEPLRNTRRGGTPDGVEHPEGWDFAASLARDFAASSSASDGPTPPGTSRWYVTNGESVVGPVDTELLLLGITSARIPTDCMVIQESWGSWRGLHQIREAARIGRPFSWATCDTDLCPGIPEALVRRARDAGEALLFAMHAAVKATNATAGLVHRSRHPFVGLVTSSAVGEGVEEQLGQVVPRLDPALDQARRNDILIGCAGPLTSSQAERAILRRFSACSREPKGVAMVPVFDGERLLAMIELARADHPFRATDTAVLRKIADVVCVK